MSTPQDIFSPGFVSGRAIQDVFTFKMSQLQHDILPLGTPDRRRIIDFFDAVRVELLAKCGPLPEVRQRAVPQPRSTEKLPDGELVADSREAYNAYAARNRRT